MLAKAGWRPLVLTLCGLALLLALAFSAGGVEGAPLTVTTRMAVVADAVGQGVEIQLAGYSLDSAQSPPALSVIWAEKQRGWFPVWEFRLEVAPGLLLATSENDFESPWDPRAVFGPQAGHSYETSLSYEPGSGFVSAAVVDATSGERLFAANASLRPYAGSLHPCQVRAVAPGAPVLDEPLLIAPGPLSTGSFFVPVGAEWDIRAWDEKAQAAAIPFGRDDAPLRIDRRQYKEVAIRLASAVHLAEGHFRLVVDDGRGAKELASVPALEGERLLPLATADLPVGQSQLLLEYVEGGRAWTLDRRKLQVGLVEVAIAPVKVEAGTWAGQLTISGDGAFPDTDLQLDMAMSPLVWDGRSFRERGSVESSVLTVGLEGIERGPLTLAFAVPPPPMEFSRWRLKFQPVLSRDAVVALTGKEDSVLLESASTLYVSTSGNDTWSGRLAQPNAAGTDGPFASLERAREEIRLLGPGRLPQGGVTVYVRGGIYPLAQTLKLGAEDSGTAESPIVYRAYPGERPILMGGRPITGFQPYQGEILKTDVAAQGFRGVYFRQLFLDGRRLHLARYPNFDADNPYGGGWAYADGKPIPMYQDIPNEPKNVFQYQERHTRLWSRPQEGEVFVFARYNWWNNIIPILRVDQDSRTITLAGDASYPIRPTDRYYVRNLFEELDAPGEWYLDRQTWTLYLWPPEGAGRADLTVYAPTMRTILELGPGTAYVTFQGFTFEGSEGTAVVLNGTTNCLIAANTIRNAGDYNGSGVAVDGGRGNGVVGNDIYEIGSHGVSIGGGDRITLTPAGNYADNNYIHHVGVFYKQGVGISLRGVGNRASHNLIHDTPRMGIMFSGNNLVIEYNHIRHVNLETADTGAVYTGGRDWLSSRGTVIRYNYFHDILGYGQEDGRWVSPHYAWGIYLDDNAGGIDVIGNIVARCIRGLIHLHNGRDNLIENNIFVDGRLQQVEYNGWSETHSYWVNHLPTMIQGYESVKGQPAWQAMRRMDIHPSQAVLPDGLIMSGNVLRRNIIYYTDSAAKLFGLQNVPLAHNEWGGNLYWHQGLPVQTRVTLRGRREEVDWLAWQQLGQDDASLVADPLFEAPERDDYRLKPDSPAFRLGFQPIALEMIGPYHDELRASWPIVEAEGAREKPLVSGP